MDEAGLRARHRARQEEKHAVSYPQSYADVAPLCEAAQDELQPVGEDNVKLPELQAYTAQTSAIRGGASPVDEKKTPEETSAVDMDTQSALGPSKFTENAKFVKMKPHLQFMAGPMLRYDTVDPLTGVWHGFAMIVTSDKGSEYTPRPSLTISYRSRHSSSDSVDHELGHERGVEPQLHLLTSSHTRPVQVSGDEVEHSSDVHAKARHRAVTSIVKGQKIYQFRGLHTFWRFKLEILLAKDEQPVTYTINGGGELQFWVPGRDQNMRWMGHSCNGFSAGVNVEAFNGSDPLWADFLLQHEKRPFHLMCGGGDQIYNDAMVREAALAPWLSSKDEKWKSSTALTEEMGMAMDRFLFNHYCDWFRSGQFARALACVPSVQMTDDHDLIDGFDPDELQRSPVFSAIGSRGYFWYQLFQNFVVDAVDGTSREKPHTYRSMIIGGDAAFMPTSSHSYLTWVGPAQALLLLDCRAERRQDQICSPETYDRVFTRIRELPNLSTLKHLIVLLGVPIAYPRMNFAENMLQSKLNPLVAIAKTGMAFGSAVNRFNSQAELLDDLNDHWCAAEHKKERNWLLEQLQSIAASCHLRVSILSGDVHAAAVGRLFAKQQTAPKSDPKFMLNVISSAIVNTPPPPGVITMMNKLSTKTHKTNKMWYCGTDEDMAPMWAEDTDGRSLKDKYILGRRNYVVVRVVEESGELEWTFRVEKKQGGGETKPYVICAPAVDY